jgi:hypothetical protein
VYFVGLYRFALKDFFIDFTRVLADGMCQYRFALKHFYSWRRNEIPYLVKPVTAWRL